MYGQRGVFTLLKVSKTRQMTNFIHFTVSNDHVELSSRMVLRRSSLRRWIYLLCYPNYTWTESHLAMMGKDKDYSAAQALSLETDTRKQRDSKAVWSQETGLEDQQAISVHQLCEMIKFTKLSICSVKQCNQNWKQRPQGHEPIYSLYNSNMGYRENFIVKVSF